MFNCLSTQISYQPVTQQQVSACRQDDTLELTASDRTVIRLKFIPDLDANSLILFYSSLHLFIPIDVDC